VERCADGVPAALDDARGGRALAPAASDRADRLARLGAIGERDWAARLVGPGHLGAVLRPDLALAHARWCLAGTGGRR